MPPTLDLSRTRHSKMIVSPPRINLRRAASYNHADRGPLSSTSSRFSFNHLLFSPPPSPGLPALVPTRPRQASGSKLLPVRPSRALRYLVWISCVLFIYYLTRLTVVRRPVVRALSWTYHAHNEYEMVEAEENLPDFPTPIAVTDKRGRAKWTISIPPSYDFPLSTGQYADLAAQCKEISERVQALHSNHGLPQTILGPFSGPSLDDRHFVDVKEAKAEGLLRGWSVKLSRVGKHGLPGNIIGESNSAQSTEQQPICHKSMTFVLESADAGLGKMLMQLWTAYGIALNEGRAFFIDDSRWAYGKYTDIFLPPPSPGCRPPPRHEMTPCPRQARHLVVSSATVGDVLIPHQAAIPETAAATAAQKDAFHLARKGYDALFHLNAEDAAYVSSRISEFATRRTDSPGNSKSTHPGLAIGLHIRRGDCHPLEYQYRASYIPTDVYIERAREILETAFNHSAPHRAEDTAAKKHSFLVLASDDPTVYDSEEIRRSSIPVLRAQDRIKLASKAAIHQAKGEPDRAVMRKFVDETFGWEGGFFASMFHHLGTSGVGGKNGAEETPNADSMRLRSLIGRAYVMDLAVLGRASDVVVCTVSAAGCRTLGVMMGWDRGIERGAWVNVDGHYGWGGVEF